MHPDAWSLGIIKPILKKKCPSNYRGITLLPVMGNLAKHSLVLDQEDELLTQSLLSPQQFNHTRREISHCLRVFVDFAKAFDSVNHQLLWEKLASMGVSTKIIRVLISMYTKASSRVAE